MRRILMWVCAGMLVFPSQAAAYCSRSVTVSMMDFDERVQDEFKYLICLHNEQNRTLDEHASMIDRQASTIMQLEMEMRELTSENSALKSELSDLSLRVDN